MRYLPVIKNKLLMHCYKIFSLKIQCVNFEDENFSVSLNCTNKMKFIKE